ncbi:AraC family transcriptional regulator [Lysinibacillus sp. NPDC047702]|uniref:AraC family transcriptional regulator n=1 Tax=unclassified Lysinibacillus TaxID=2636778 RepID=UPI003CFC76E1
MNYEAYMLLWQNAYIKLKQIDYVQNTSVRTTKVLKYSTLLIITEGAAEILIDDQPYFVQSFTIFHIGKSQSLHITADKLSYYLIYYRGDIVYSDTFMQHLQMKYQPFQTILTCVPANPIAIHTVLQDMYIKWQSGSIQEHLSVKASFYGLIYRVFQELVEGYGKPHEIDKAEAARLYIEQHINEPLSIQKLADLLNISTRHLLRIFKARFEVGPQVYLQQLRIEQAKKYLLTNQFSIKEIAISLGFEDEYYFSRAFKKVTNMAPSNYRLNYPSNMSEITITIENSFQYNENQLAQANRFKNEVMITNRIQQLKLPFLLKLFVLFSACGEKDSIHQTSRLSIKKAMTRTVIDDSGREVVIPVKAERIVTDWYLGQILALDVVPVGAVTANLDFAAFLKPYYKDEDILNIGTDGNVSIEKIVEIKPDLIVTWNSEDVGKYEKIAPTIVFSETAHKTAADEIKAMGEYLGRQQEADAFIKNFENRITKAQEKINAVVSEESTFTIFDLFAKKATVVGNKSVSGGRALYQILGVKPQEKVQNLFDTKDPSRGRYEISYEVVGDYVGDYVFVINFFNKEGKFPSTWTDLDVVKNRQTIQLASEYYFASDPLSGLHQAEDIADKIMKFTLAK